MLSIFVLNIVLEISGRARKIKGMQIRKEEVKLSLFKDNMTLKILRHLPNN